MGYYHAITDIENWKKGEDATPMGSAERDRERYLSQLTKKRQK